MFLEVYKVYHVWMTMDVGDTSFGSVRCIGRYGHVEMATSAALAAQRIKTLLFEI